MSYFGEIDEIQKEIEVFQTMYVQDMHQSTVFKARVKSYKEIIKQQAR